MHQISVNGNPVRINDQRPIGSQVLITAGFEPADEHILIESAKLGSRLISLDEAIHLRGNERFYAFRTGEVFTFTVDGHGFQWGEVEIAEPKLREFANLSEDEVFVLDRANTEPQILTASDKVGLGAAGTEHLRTQKRLVNVFYDDVPKLIPRGTYTTEQLIALFGVQAGYLLNLESKGG